MLRARRRDDPRSEAQIVQHYMVEREIAERLRTATRDERRTMYAAAYDELLQRVPHHPMLLPRAERAASAERAVRVKRSLGFLGRFLMKKRVVMELGAGDCALAVQACGRARRVYAIEVSAQITQNVVAPPNLELVLTDGFTLPLPDSAVDVAFSDQLMEHLHPEDALNQLREIYRCLAPGGVYVCVTPNRLYGPQDVSGYFDELARGMHLREYSAREMRALLLETGFARVKFYSGARGWFARCPYPLLALVERMLDALPYRLRKAFADNPVARAFLGVRVAAFK